MSTYQEIDATALNAMMSGGGVTLIDVRADDEVARGMIPGARHIPLALLPTMASELSNSTGPMVFYCHSGMRSAQACAFLCKTEHEHVFNLRGGILAWGKAGLPLIPKN